MADTKLNTYARINKETADLTTAVIHLLQDELPKHGLSGADTHEAMEAIIRGWSGGDLVLLDLEREPEMMERLKGWSERTGCTVGEAARRVLTGCADAILPTPEEDAELDATMAQAKVAMADPLSPKKDWQN
jgi:hypothetical protein